MISSFKREKEFLSSSSLSLLPRGPRERACVPRSYGEKDQGGHLLGAANTSSLMFYHSRLPQSFLSPRLRHSTQPEAFHKCPNVACAFLGRVTRSQSRLDSSCKTHSFLSQ